MSRLLGDSMDFMRRKGDNPEVLQALLIQHIESQKASLDHLTESTDSIRVDLNSTIRTITEHLATNQLQLIETKTEILNAVLEKFVEKEDYSMDALRTEAQIIEIQKTLDNKVDKNTVKTLWILLTSVAAVAAFYLKEGI